MQKGQEGKFYRGTGNQIVSGLGAVETFDVVYKTPPGDGDTKRLLPLFYGSNDEKAVTTNVDFNWHPLHLSRVRQFDGFAAISIKNTSKANAQTALQQFRYDGKLYAAAFQNVQCSMENVNPLTVNIPLPVFIADGDRTCRWMADIGHAKDPICYIRLRTRGYHPTLSQWTAIFENERLLGVYWVYDCDTFEHLEDAIKIYKKAVKLRTHPRAVSFTMAATVNGNDAAEWLSNRNTLNLSADPSAENTKKKTKKELKEASKKAYDRIQRDKAMEGRLPGNTTVEGTQMFTKDNMNETLKYKVNPEYMLNPTETLIAQAQAARPGEQKDVGIYVGDGVYWEGADAANINLKRVAWGDDVPWSADDDSSLASNWHFVDPPWHLYPTNQSAFILTDDGDQHPYKEYSADNADGLPGHVLALNSFITKNRYTFAETPLQIFPTRYVSDIERKLKVEETADETIRETILQYQKHADQHSYNAINPYETFAAFKEQRSKDRERLHAGYTVIFADTRASHFKPLDDSMVLKSYTIDAKRYMAAYLIRMIDMLHEDGVIHGSIHTNRLLFNTRSGQLQLTDFSLGCMAAEETRLRKLVRRNKIGVAPPAVDGWYMNGLDFDWVSAACRIHRFCGKMPAVQKQIADRIKSAEAKRMVTEDALESGVNIDYYEYLRMCKMKELWSTTTLGYDTTLSLLPYGVYYNPASLCAYKEFKVWTKDPNGPSLLSTPQRAEEILRGAVVHDKANENPRGGTVLGDKRDADGKQVQGIVIPKYMPKQTARDPEQSVYYMNGVYVEILKVTKGNGSVVRYRNSRGVLFHRTANVLSHQTQSGRKSVPQFGQFMSPFGQVDLGVKGKCTLLTQTISPFRVLTDEAQYLLGRTIVSMFLGLADSRLYPGTITPDRIMVSPETMEVRFLNPFECRTLQNPALVTAYLRMQVCVVAQFFYRNEHYVAAAACFHHMSAADRFAAELEISSEDFIHSARRYGFYQQFNESDAYKRMFRSTVNHNLDIHEEELSRDGVSLMFPGVEEPVGTRLSGGINVGVPMPEADDDEIKAQILAAASQPSSSSSTSTAPPVAPATTGDILSRLRDSLQGVVSGTQSSPFVTSQLPPPTS